MMHVVKNNASVDMILPGQVNVNQSVSGNGHCLCV